MRSIVLASGLLAAILTFPAVAADLKGDWKTSLKDGPPPTPPHYLWTGFYFGAGGGCAHSNLDSQRLSSFFAYKPNIANEIKRSAGGDGCFGTLMVGLDKQLGRHFVAGVFADFDFGGTETNWDIRRGGENSRNLAGKFEQDDAWSVGGRFGWLIQPHTLLYVSGGYTETDINNLEFKSFGGFVNRIADGPKLKGGFVGAGMETLFKNNWSLRLEGRYTDYKSDRVTLFTPDGEVAIRNHDIDFGTLSGRAVLAHKFNWNHKH